MRQVIPVIVVTILHTQLDVLLPHCEDGRSRSLSESLTPTDSLGIEIATFVERAVASHPLDLETKEIHIPAQHLLVALRPHELEGTSDEFDPGKWLDDCVASHHVPRIQIAPCEAVIVADIQVDHVLGDDVHQEGEERLVEGHEERA